MEGLIVNEIGFIKLHRQILNWEWYSDINTTRLFIHLLLTANYENKKWQGIDIPRGSLINTYQKLAQQIGLTIQQTRTSLNKLELTGEITRSKGLNYTLISITYYNNYQSINKIDNRQSTDNQQTDNREVTTTKEVKKERKKEYIYNDLINEFSEYRKKIKKPMTEKAKELADKKLFTLAGNNEELAKEIVEQSIFNNWTGLFELKNNNFKKQDPYNGKTPEQIKAEFFKDL